MAEDLMKIEIQGTFNGGYIIFDAEGPILAKTVSSDANLRSYLRKRGVEEWRINSAIEDLRHPPRKVELTV